MLGRRGGTAVRDGPASMLFDTPPGRVRSAKCGRPTADLLLLTPKAGSPCVQMLRVRPVGFQLGVRAPAAAALVRGTGGARGGDGRGRHHGCVAAAALRLCHSGGKAMFYVRDICENTLKFTQHV